MTIGSPTTSTPDIRPDAELLLAAAAGERPAFEIVYERHVMAIHSFLRVRVGQTQAEDLAAETFAVAWSRRHRFRSDATSARPWLYGIATHVLHRHAESERRWNESVRAHRADAAQGDRASANELDFEPDLRLLQALALLSPSERDVLLLTALGELSPKEAASQLEISVVAARVRLHRARRRMSQALTEAEHASS